MYEVLPRGKARAKKPLEHRIFKSVTTWEMIDDRIVNDAEMG
jgi:hypothetical protein